MSNDSTGAFTIVLNINSKGISPGAPSCSRAHAGAAVDEGARALTAGAAVDEGAIHELVRKNFHFLGISHGARGHGKEGTKVWIAQERENSY